MDGDATAGPDRRDRARNVPLAAVLWNGGISFGCVIAFLFADLLILPILNIYRKYYGLRMMLALLGSCYAAMVAAGYLVEVLFGVAGLIPRASPTTSQAERSGPDARMLFGGKTRTT